jgi:hypothetical protein
MYKLAECRMLRLGKWSQQSREPTNIGREVVDLAEDYANMFHRHMSNTWNISICTRLGRSGVPQLQ